MAERKSFLLRISPELWGDLEAWAADELRSVNGQIEYLLRDAVQRRRRTAAGESGAVAPSGLLADPGATTGTPPPEGAA